MLHPIAVADDLAVPRPNEGEIDHWRFFDLSQEVLAISGFDGTLRAVNPAFGLLVGTRPAALVDAALLQLVHPEDVPGTQEELDALGSGAGSAFFENRILSGDGSYRWLHWSVTADAEAALLYFVAYDVTERRVQHEVVDKLVVELQRSNADLGQFAYVASHDLSEPLRMVSSYVQLLAERYSGQLDADADEFIGYALDGATRMKALIDDLLAYSRSGRVAPVRRTMDCGAVLRDVVSDLGAVVNDCGATVVVGELPVLLSDPGLLSQLFQNLLANGLKFVPPGQAPVIDVSAVRVGAEWHIAVRDNGIGIAEKHRERIFMMFKRLHGRSEYPGTGIGLALCQQIVARLDGRVWVESEPGEGSTFVVALPAMAEGDR